MGVFPSAVLGALLCAGAAHADERHRPPPPQPAAQRSAQRPPLSKEDAELVKELALLEQMELVRNLELFQPDDRDEKQPAVKHP